MSRLIRIVIQLPEDLKTQLDGLKQQGYTTSGFIRAIVERELQKPEYQPSNGRGRSNGDGDGTAGQVNGKYQGKGRL